MAELSVKDLSTFWIKVVDPDLNELCGTNVDKKERFGYYEDMHQKEKLVAVGRRLESVFSDRINQYEEWHGKHLPFFTQYRTETASKGKTNHEIADELLKDLKAMLQENSSEQNANYK